MLGTTRAPEEAADWRRPKALADLPPSTQGLAVHDEGDFIGLNEDIGQRLSKFTKTGEPTAAERFEIAKKIFTIVDQKSAEPKTKADSGKGISRASQLFANELKLTPEEKKIAKSPLEILLVYQADGRLKNVTLGNERDVAIPPGTAADAILSHNHPTGRGPSDSDVKAVLSTPGRTLRVVARNERGKLELFELQANGPFSDEEIRYLVAEYETACAALGDTPQARREALALILDAANGRFLAKRRVFP